MSSPSYHRTPVSFGPFPGPRQSASGSPRSGHETTSLTLSLTFRTPKAGIRDLLPSAYSFQDEEGEDAYVTFAVQRLGNLGWLAGRGYDLLGIYVRGVRYSGSDGREGEGGTKVYNGRFLLLMLENMADPIISGREELGFPKLYCELDVLRSAGVYEVAMGWEGSAKFGRMRVGGLVEVEPLIERDEQKEEERKKKEGMGIDEGILVHRYVPAVGEPGVADAEYACWVEDAREEAECEGRVVREWRTGGGSVSFDGLTWEELPTLHHIAKRLAGIDLKEVIEAKVVEKVGMSTLRSARRI
jgi:hypothetical protein